MAAAVALWVIGEMSVFRDFQRAGRYLDRTAEPGVRTQRDHRSDPFEDPSAAQSEGAFRIVREAVRAPADVFVRTDQSASVSSYQPAHAARV